MGMTFTAAIAKFFGRKPGQTMAEFRDEIVALTPKDKEEMRAMLAAELKTDIDPYHAPAV